jgi:hypothetical protein
LKFHIIVSQGGRRSLRFTCKGKKENGENYSSTHIHTFVRTGRF